MEMVISQNYLWKKTVDSYLLCIFVAGHRQNLEMKVRLIFPTVVTAVLASSCASPELPASSRIGKRQAIGNQDLRLPSQWGSNPSQRDKWWQGQETRYPNSGYYSSD